MTLHAAIERVLADAGRPLTTREIADAVNERRLYTRGDGKPIPASQISARVRNYGALFTKHGNQVKLEGGDSQTMVDSRTESKSQQRQHIAGSLPERPGSEHPVDPLSLLAGGNFRSVGDVVNLIPDRPGVYAIRVTDFSVLPEPFRSKAQDRDDRLIYIGEAKTSLRKRLGQELWAKGHGTFFRSIGGVIGHRPIPGSLALQVNKNNYTFAPDDEATITLWINQNLEVSWLVLESGVHDIEVRLIREFGPLLNLSGNPRKLSELSRVRNECRIITSMPSGKIGMEPTKSSK